MGKIITGFIVAAGIVWFSKNDVQNIEHSDTKKTQEQSSYYEQEKAPDR